MLQFFFYFFFFFIYSFTVYSVDRHAKKFKSTAINESFLQEQDKSQSNAINVSLIQEADTNFKILDSLWDQNLLIKEIKIDADSLIWKDEINYLLDFKLPSKISLEQIKIACWNLQQKQRFESVTLKITKLDEESANLHLFFFTNFTFGKVKCKGNLVGKDKFIQKYLIRSGQPFNIEHHQQSLKAIKNSLYQDGYLEAELEDHIAYNTETKTVNVKIFIDKVKQFAIKTTKLTIEHKIKEHKIDNKAYEKINNFLTTLSEKFKGQLALESNITNFIGQLKLTLAQNGFYNVFIDYKLSPIKKNKALLEFIIKLGEEKHFTFAGNNFFTGQELLDQLIVLDNLLVLIPPLLLSEDLEQLYKSKGFWNVKVNCKETQNEFCFEIEEGERIIINKVNIFLLDVKTDKKNKLIEQAEKITDQIIEKKLLTINKEFKPLNFYF